MRQLFMWAAHCEDCTIITEFNPDGTENPYNKLPREKIVNFGLIQGQRSSYFIDLKTGVFHLKDHRINKTFNIVLPISKNKGVAICGGAGVNYAFNNFKEAHQDFNAIGHNMGGTVIDKYLIGWSAWKNVPTIGKRYVEATLFIDNVEAPKPVLKVFLRAEPKGTPIDGSPYDTSI